MESCVNKWGEIKSFRCCAEKLYTAELNYVSGMCKEALDELLCRWKN